MKFSLFTKKPLQPLVDCIAAKMEAEYQKSRRDSARRIVSLLSRGNVNLQAGRYITESDIDALREEVRGYDFSSL